MKLDAQIQTDVIQELKWDPSVTHEHIGVAVSEGVVTLSGVVPSYIEKSAAEKAAQRVGGVKAVVEKIEVQLPGQYHRDDVDIAKAIIQQFRWHGQVPSEAIKVSVQNGCVDLTGEVDWDYQRRAAENAAKGLIGVKGIQNRIAIKPRPAQPYEIEEKIEDALKRAAEREASRINVQVRGGHVTLSGKVRSFAELRAVRGAAFSAPGVTMIDDTDLKVAV
jgi:osmotically-inducible protein OsmY